MSVDELTLVDVADWQRSPVEFLRRTEAGECVVVQRNGEPVAVLLSAARYSQWIDAEAKLENLELLLLALKREAAILSGDDRLVPLEEAMTEFGVDPKLAE